MTSRVLHLPDCCSRTPLRLPRPTNLRLGASLSPDGSSAWEMGLDEWHVTVHASWFDDSELARAVGDHAGGALTGEEVTAILAAHGVVLDDEGDAVVATASICVLRSLNDFAPALGRAQIGNGCDMWEAADAAAGDLEKLVGPLVDMDDDAEFWSPALLDLWDEAQMASNLLIVRAVAVNPTCRGHTIGAWGVAAAINLFDGFGTIAAAYAAPLHPGDSVPDYVERADMTAEQKAAWDEGQQRLAQHWQDTLGFRPLSSDPAVLTWATAEINETIKRTIALYRA